MAQDKHSTVNSDIFGHIKSQNTGISITDGTIDKNPEFRNQENSEIRWVDDEVVDCIQEQEEPQKQKKTT